MKITSKCLVLGLSFVAFASVAMAQDGNINFATFNNNSAKGEVFSVTGVPAIGPTFVGQLYGGTVNNINSLTPIGTSQAFSTSVPGYISANPALVTATGSAPGDSYFYSLFAWNASAGSYTVASTTGTFGHSAVVGVTLGGTDAFGDFFTTPTANGFASFTLTTIPEPTTFALAGLGIAALLVARRRKQQA